MGRVATQEGVIVKIEGGGKSLGPPATGKQTVATGHAPRQAPAIEATRVDISSLSARLQFSDASLTEGGTVDAARVAEIKRAIADGRFSINPERIADGLLQSVRDLLNRRQ